MKIKTLTDRQKFIKLLNVFCFDKADLPLTIFNDRGVTSRRFKLYHPWNVKYSEEKVQLFVKRAKRVFGSRLITAKIITCNSRYGESLHSIVRIKLVD